MTPLTPPSPSLQRLLEHPRRLPAEDQPFPLHHHRRHRIDPARAPQRLLVQHRLSESCEPSYPSVPVLAAVRRPR